MQTDTQVVSTHGEEFIYKMYDVMNCINFVILMRSNLTINQNLFIIDMNQNISTHFGTQKILQGGWGFKLHAPH